MVIQRGDPGDNFYVVTEGCLAAYIAAVGDEPIQEYRAGDTFSVSSPCCTAARARPRSRPARPACCGRWTAAPSARS